ncbi:hypothetical protein TrVE_jg14458 [Triparma verrucosa]|uniref:Bromo domain-containing protein n=1 Tax=Triparma verrucosa TaxID=1606542 RepID=A0A9W7C3Y8_9STRA|nr:hypothetical protein TrVE_jg14458 [Triparma verrucosa]
MSNNNSNKTAPASASDESSDLSLPASSSSPPLPLPSPSSLALTLSYLRSISTSSASLSAVDTLIKEYESLNMFSKGLDSVLPGPVVFKERSSYMATLPVGPVREPEFNNIISKGSNESCDTATLPRAGRERIKDLEYRLSFKSFTEDPANYKRVGELREQLTTLKNGRKMSVTPSSISGAVLSSSVPNILKSKSFLTLGGRISPPLPPIPTSSTTINTHLCEPVTCVTFLTPSHFLTGSDDFLIKLFLVKNSSNTVTRNTTSGNIKSWIGCGAKLLRTFRGHSSYITDLHGVSGKRFISSSSDKTVRMWCSRGPCLRVWVFENEVYRCFYVKGCVGGIDDCGVKVWEVDGGEEEVEQDLPNLPLSPGLEAPAQGGGGAQANNNNDDPKKWKKYRRYYESGLPERTTVFSANSPYKRVKREEYRRRTRSQDVRWSDTPSVVGVDGEGEFCVGYDDGYFEFLRFDRGEETFKRLVSSKELAKNPFKEKGEGGVGLEVEDVKYDGPKCAIAGAGKVILFDGRLDPSRKTYRTFKLTHKTATIHIKGKPSGSRKVGGLEFCGNLLAVSSFDNDLTEGMAKMKKVEREKHDGRAVIDVFNMHGGQRVWCFRGHWGRLCMGFFDGRLWSAGKEGEINLWNLRDGRCKTLGVNKFEHGMEVEGTEYEVKDGRRVGVCEGSSGGGSIVLGDEAGRVVCFFAGGKGEKTVRGDNIEAWKESPWQKEQYFSTDYCSFFYDSCGLPCVSRLDGTVVPLNEAPIGERTNHLMVPVTGSESVETKEVFDWEERGGRDWVFKSVEGGEVESKGYKLFKEEREKERQVVPQPQRQPRQPRQPRQLNPNYIWHGDDDVDGDGTSNLPITLDEDHDDSDDESFTEERRLKESDDEGELEATFDSDIDDSDSGSDDDDSFMRRGRPGSREEIRSRAARRRRRQQEGAHQQPGRTSERNLGRQRKVYEDVGSEDEEIQEEIPLHNPALEPRRAIDEGQRVDDSWLRRSFREDPVKSSIFFAPQVGDSVVYVPKMHMDFLDGVGLAPKPFPWAHFPKNSKDPLNTIRCEVVDAEYLFGGEGEGNESVVQRLTLRLTGIPEERENSSGPATTSSRRLQTRVRYPWPSPNFVSPLERCLTKNDGLTLVVDWFRHPLAAHDWLIPEDLYVTRVKAVEEALAAMDVGVYLNEESLEQPQGEVKHVMGSSFYLMESSVGEGDPEAAKYECAVVGTNLSDASEEERFADSCLNDSGVKTLWVTFPKGGTRSGEINLKAPPKSEDKLSPWEFEVTDTRVKKASRTELSKLAHRRLGGGAVKTLKRAVEELIGNGIYADFVDDVDLILLPDYRALIPVEINLSLLERRLGSGYYSCIESFKSDVDLMWENCQHYNKKKSTAYGAGKEIHEDLSEAIESTGFAVGNMNIERVRGGRGGGNKRKWGGDDDDDEYTDHDSPAPRSRKTRNSSSKTWDDEEEEEFVTSDDDDDDESNSDSDALGGLYDDSDVGSPSPRKTRRGTAGKRNGGSSRGARTSSRTSRVTSTTTATTTSSRSSSRNSSAQNKKRKLMYEEEEEEEENEFDDEESDEGDGITNKSRRISAPSAPQTSQRSSKRRVIEDEEEEEEDSVEDAQSLELERVNSKRDIESVGKKILTKFRQRRCDRSLKKIFEDDPSMYPDYANVIKPNKPMWYDKISKKLSANKYKTLKLLKNDFELIFTNAMRYNVEGTPVYELATELMHLVSAIVEEVIKADVVIWRKYFME